MNRYGGLYIYLLPPSIQELEHRIRARGQNTEESIRRRIKKAEEQQVEFEQNRSVFDNTCVNDDLDRCMREIEGLIDKKLLSR